MSLNHHKKSQFGGELGKEFDRIWEAIRENRVVATKGQRIKRTPSGTIIEQQSTAVEGTSGNQPATEGAFLYDPFDPTGQIAHSPFGQVAVWMDLGVGAGGEQLVMLPPTLPNDYRPMAATGNMPTVFYDGEYWPATNQLLQATGSGWKHENLYITGETYQVTKFTDIVYATDYSAFGGMATKGRDGNPCGNVRIWYYLDTTQQNSSWESSNGKTWEYYP